MKPTSGTSLLFLPISIVCNMMCACHIMTYNLYDWLANQRMKDEVGRTNPVVQPCNSHMVSLNLPTLHYIIQGPLFNYYYIFFRATYLRVLTTFIWVMSHPITYMYIQHDMYIFSYIYTQVVDYNTTAGKNEKIKPCEQYDYII